MSCSGTPRRPGIEPATFRSPADPLHLPSYCLHSSLHSHVGGEDAVEQLHLGQVEGALQLVVVEGDLPGPGAVEPRLHEGGPGVLKQEAAPDVVLADAAGAREHRAPAVVLHRVLPEEEVGEVADVVGRDEVGLWVRRGEGRHRKSGRETF